MSDRDVCANCGEFYEHHMKTTQCYPDSADKWFPRKLADTITAFQAGATREDGVGDGRTSDGCEARGHVWNSYNKAFMETCIVCGKYRDEPKVDTPLKDRELQSPVVIDDKSYWIDYAWKLEARLAAALEERDHALSQLRQDDDQMGDLAIRKAAENA
jgi:hypothetical protein